MLHRAPALSRLLPRNTHSPQNDVFDHVDQVDPHLRLQIIEQAHLILHEFEVDFLWVPAIFHNDYHFPFGEPTVESFCLLNEFYCPGQLICHAVIL